jgi:hypothetical protein
MSFFVDAGGKLRAYALGAMDLAALMRGIDAITKDR